jgi:hypothetical protein
MNKTLVLSTHWREGYWESDGSSTAIYPDTKYTRMSDWEEVSEECPVAGIGLYHTRIDDENFVYLKVNEMSYDNTGEPRFVFESLRESDTESYKLDRELSGRLFYTVGKDELLDILDEVDEAPPQTWMNNL